MTYSDLIQLYFERSNSLQNYWTLYVVVIGGLLAFSSIRKQGDAITTAIVSVLFAFFAYKNLGAIEEVSLQRFAVLEAIKAVPASPEIASASKAIGPTLNPPALPGVRNFHITSDIVTILALWSMERRRRRYQGDANAATH